MNRRNFLGTVAASIAAVAAAPLVTWCRPKPDDHGFEWTLRTKRPGSVVPAGCDEYVVTVTLSATNDAVCGIRAYDGLGRELSL